MPLRDSAIIGYAETKIVPRSDVDVWELGAEILEQLLETLGQAVVAPAAQHGAFIQIETSVQFDLDCMDPLARLAIGLGRIAAGVGRVAHRLQA